MSETISLVDAHALTLKALVAAGTSQANAHAVADALVAAEADGLASHGSAGLPPKPIRRRPARSRVRPCPS